MDVFVVLNMDAGRILGDSVGVYLTLHAAVDHSEGFDEPWVQVATDRWEQEFGPGDKLIILKTQIGRAVDRVNEDPDWPEHKIIPLK